MRGGNVRTQRGETLVSCLTCGYRAYVIKQDTVACPDCESVAIQVIPPRAIGRTGVKHKRGHP